MADETLDYGVKRKRSSPIFPAVITSMNVCLLYLVNLAIERQIEESFELLLMLAAAAVICGELVVIIKRITADKSRSRRFAFWSLWVAIWSIFVLLFIFLRSTMRH